MVPHLESRGAWVLWVRSRGATRRSRAPYFDCAVLYDGDLKEYTLFSRVLDGPLCQTAKITRRVYERYGRLPEYYSHREWPRAYCLKAEQQRSVCGRSTDRHFDVAEVADP